MPGILHETVSILFVMTIMARMAIEMAIEMTIEMRNRHWKHQDIADCSA